MRQQSTQLGACRVAPLRPHFWQRAHRRSMSLDVSGRQRMMSGARAIVARDLLNKVDDALPQSWLRYLHECLGEREPVPRGEEIENVGR